MAELRKLGMPISVKAPAKKKNTAVTYAKMKKYISLMDEADKYMAEFEAVIEESKTTNKAYPKLPCISTSTRQITKGITDPI